MSTRVLCLSLSSFFLMAVLFNGCHQEVPEADLILTNGVFFTVNPEQPVAEAVAIKGDRILAVGHFSQMNPYRRNTTRILDLKGAFACPGFNDAHINLADGGMAMHELDLTDVNSVAAVRRLVRDQIRNSGVGSWVLGRGWDQDILLEGEWPDKYMLDRVAWDWPVFLRRKCGHMVWVNSLALKIANVTSETPEPTGGVIVKDPRSGNPTGLLKGTAVDLIAQYITPLKTDESRRIVTNAVRGLAKYGLTTVQDHSPPETIELFHELQEKDELTCRLTKAMPSEMESNEYQNARNRFDGPMLRVGHLFVEIDGWLSSRTAALFQSYSDDPSNQGMMLVDPDVLKQRLIHADIHHIPVSAGAVGDAANILVLDLYKRIQSISQNENNRYRLEYAQMLNQEALQVLKTLNAVVTTRPFLCIDDLQRFEARIGLDRCRYVHAWRSMKNQGAVLAFASGWPCGPVNPMLGLYAAVTRRDTLGHPLEGWFPKERLTIEEAIEAYTLGSAYAEHMEGEKGSLESGKLADVIVIDRNLLTIAAEDIRKAKILYTMVGGKIVYVANPDSSSGS